MSANLQMLLQWLHTHANGASLCTDSRQLKAGEVFVALKGDKHDGRDYMEAMVEKGAIAVLCEADGLHLPASFNRAGSVPYLSVSGLKNALDAVAPRYYAQPDRSMTVYAVTGTNGKTTCSQWLGQALAQLSGSALVIGTLGIWKYNGRAEGKAYYDTGYTTPDSLGLFRALSHAQKDQVKALAIEASSIGLVEKRLAHLHIDVALFTNLTQDHLDYHGSMLAYEAAKRQLFDTPSLHWAVLNLEDPMAWRVLARLKNRPVAVVGYGLNPDIVAQFIAQYPQHHYVQATIEAQENATTRIALQAQLEDVRFSHTLSLPILGAFNISNALAVMAALLTQKIDPQKVFEVMKELRAVPGRMQVVGQVPLVLVDFAHTPDAIEKVLTTLRPIAQARQGRLWCVFGCGGNRDPLKRPLMGRAAQLADHIVLTSDNPRDEDPARIIADIEVGLNGRAATVLVDRAQAITAAISLAQESDVIVIAGKGHEKTQEIKGEKKPFEDALHAQLALKSRAFNQQFFGNHAVSQTSESPS